MAKTELGGAILAEPAQPVSKEDMLAAAVTADTAVLTSTVSDDGQILMSATLADGSKVKGTFVVDNNDAGTDLDRVIVRTISMSGDRSFTGDFLVLSGGTPLPGGPTKTGSGLLSEAVTEGIMDQKTADALQASMTLINSWLAARAGFVVA